MFYWTAHAHFFSLPLLFPSFRFVSLCVSYPFLSFFPSRSLIHPFHRIWISMYLFCYCCLSAFAWCSLPFWHRISSTQMSVSVVCICLYTFLCILFVCCMQPASQPASQLKLLKSVSVIQPINFRYLVLIRNDLPHWRDLMSTWALLTIG